MREKTKEFAKRYLLGFVTGSILFGCIGVYAATYFPSNQTTYDNSDSGMTSTNVQGALDELYRVCKTTPAEEIIENGNLEKDEYECRYFFTGSNPNNYITFNNETWRILSVECDGSIKILKSNSIGDKDWDYSGRFGNNNWSTASLNTELNGTYYNELSSTAKNQIITHDWSIGIITADNSDLADQINDENSTKWNGKIALATISEYLRTCSDKDCQRLRRYNVNANYCETTTWVFNSFMWSLSACTDQEGYDGHTAGTSSGGFLCTFLNNNYSVYPSLYLSPDIKITGGTGTQSDPYTIE